MSYVACIYLSSPLSLLPPAVLDVFQRYHKEMSGPYSCEQRKCPFIGGCGGAVLEQQAGHMRFGELPNPPPRPSHLPLNHSASRGGWVGGLCIQTIMAHSQAFQVWEQSF